MISPSPIGGLSFRIAAILICMTCIFYTAVMRSINRTKARGRLFLVLLILTVIDCCTGIVSTLVSYYDFPDTVKNFVSYSCRFIYYLTHMAFTPVLAIYIMIVCEVFHKLTKVKLILFVMPFALLELAVITNPLTGFIFTMHDGQFYSRGIGVYIAYTIAALYVGFCVILMGIYRRTMNTMQKVATLYFLALAIIGTVVQMLIPSIVCELMGEALGLMGIMIMIERDDYRLDYKTHANNRAALLHDLNNLVALRRHFYTICIRIENAETYRRLMGNDSYDYIMAKGADFIRFIDTRYETYRTTAGNFFVVCPEATKKDVDHILNTIEERFRKGFAVQSGLTTVKVKILCARCPEELEDVEDILLLSDTDIEDSDKMVFKGDDLSFLLKKIEIEKAIVRGLNGDSFKVLYMPVYDRATRQIASAEALLTLNDKMLGEVQFKDFMAVSKETGFVEELQYRMIEFVFMFIKNAIIKEKTDIKLIAIHILSVHILKPNFVEKVKGYINEYEIDPAYVVFSISDNIAIQAPEILESIIDDFTELGINFVLSNNDAGLLSLNPQVVKKFSGVSIDVSRHYEGTEIEQAGIILANRLNFIKQLDKLVIVRGVENQYYYNLVKNLPADYISGNYLSERVSKNELQVKFWHREVIWE